MKQEKYYLDLDRYEHGVVIKSLNRYRNELLRQERTTDVVDELILKTAEAPRKKFRVIEKSGTNETR